MVSFRPLFVIFHGWYHDSYCISDAEKLQGAKKQARAAYRDPRPPPGKKRRIKKGWKGNRGYRYRTFLFSAPGVVTMTVSGVMISAPFAVAAPWNICSIMALNVATTGPSVTCSAVPRI